MMMTKKFHDIEVRVLEIIGRHAKKDAKLLPILHDIQDAFGCIPKGAIEIVARELNKSPGEIYDAASFYSFFRFEKPAKHVIRVCCGVVCHLKGSEEIVNAIREEYGVGPGDVSEDGLFALEAVECIGRCESPPAMLVDDDSYGNLTPEKALEILRRYEE